MPGLRRRVPRRLLPPAAVAPELRDRDRRAGHERAAALRRRRRPGRRRVGAEAHGHAGRAHRPPHRRLLPPDERRQLRHRRARGRAARARHPRRRRARSALTAGPARRRGARHRDRRRAAAAAVLARRLRAARRARRARRSPRCAAPSTAASRDAGRARCAPATRRSSAARSPTWLFDVAALAAAFAAIGSVPPVGVLLLAYVVGQLGGLIPLPGGVGGADGGLIAALVLYGTPLSRRRGRRARLPRLPARPAGAARRRSRSLACPASSSGRRTPARCASRARRGGSARSPSRAASRPRPPRPVAPSPESRSRSVAGSPRRAPSPAPAPPPELQTAGCENGVGGASGSRRLASIEAAMTPPIAPNRCACQEIPSCGSRPCSSAEAPDADDDDADGELGEAPAVDAARDEVGGVAEDEPARAEVDRVGGRDEPHARAR